MAHRFLRRGIAAVVHRRRAVRTLSTGVSTDPAEFRARCRAGEFATQTSGQCMGHAQANLVVLPRDLAYDFLLFCQRNPKPCPLLDVTEGTAGGGAGSGGPRNYEPAGVAPGADLRTDLPRYRVWRDGELAEECADVRHVWGDDLVAFLFGCSFSFEGALVDEGLRVRHLDNGTNVPMYRTAVPCAPAGRFAGPLVVSMRPFNGDANANGAGGDGDGESDVARAARVTSRFPRVHGAPVHAGDPAALGIADLGAPDWGDPVAVDESAGEVPVFWACGVTPQAVVEASKPPLAITHAPGCMFVCDTRNEDLAVDAGLDAFTA